MDNRTKLLYVVVVTLCIVALIATGLSAWLRSDSSGDHEQDHHESRRSSCLTTASLPCMSPGPEPQYTVQWMWNSPALIQ